MTAQLNAHYVKEKAEALLKSSNDEAMDYISCVIVLCDEAIKSVAHKVNHTPMVNVDQDDIYLLFLV